MKSFEIRLDFPPSVNANWQYAKGKVFVKKKVLGYKAKVKSIVKQAIKEKYPEFIPFENPISYEAIYYEPDHKIRDLDNLKKVIWDALKSARVIKDDSLFKKIKSEIKFNSSLKGSVFIKIQEII